MHFTNCLLFIFTLVISFTGLTQTESHKEDSLMLRKIYNEALDNGQAYEDLRSLCKDIGARLSGSVSAEMAVQWGYHKLVNYGFDTVYFQERSEERRVGKECRTRRSRDD